MIRTAFRAAGALLLSALTLSCAPIPPAPFNLRGEDGAVHAMSPDSRLPRGHEGTIGGGGRVSVRYALKDAVEVRGSRTSLEIRYELSGAARLEVFPEGRNAAPLVSADLPGGPGRIRWILPLPADAELSTFRFTALAAGPGSKAEDSILRIQALALAPSLFGFERLPEGARFSRGSSLARSASGTETVRIEHPYGPGEEPVIRIDSTGGTLRLRAEGGRSAALDVDLEGGVFLPLSVLGGSGAVTVEASGPEPIRSAAVLPARDLPGPLPLDLAAVLALPAPPDPPPAFQLYRWSAFPACLVFDFRDYAAQDAYLKRLAFFVEKEGFRGRLAPDSEIEKLHGWNAHDYRSEDLAAFFDEAGRTSFPLSKEEVELRGILEREGILVREGDRFKAGAGVIISISRESTVYLRDLFLTHEASHALFFLDSAYRSLARSLWTAQGPEERRFWNVFLSNRDYDPGDAYLSYNELQAYLVQQTPSRLESWLKDVAYARLAKSYPDRAAAILADLEAALPGFLAKAETLDSYLRKSYGFRGGSFRRLRFE